MALSSFTIADNYLFSNESSAITIHRDNPNYTHNVQFWFGNILWEKLNVATSTTFRPNDARTDAQWATIIPSNSPIISGRIQVTTYNGTQYIGTTSQIAHIYVRADNRPTVGTLTITDQVAALGTALGSKRFAQNQSTIQMAVTGATAGTGTTVDYIQISCDGRSNKGASWVFGKPTKTGTFTVAWTVYDKRGYSTSSSTTFVVLPYTAPRITTFRVTRASTTVTMTMGGALSSLTDGTGAQKQAYRIVVKRKPNSGEFTTVYNGTAVVGTTFSIAPIDTVNPELTYRYEMTLTDLAGVSTAAHHSVSTDAAVMHLSKTGVGVGKYHEKATLDVAGNEEIVALNGYLNAMLSFYPRNQTLLRYGYIGYAAAATQSDFRIHSERGDIQLYSVRDIAFRTRLEGATNEKEWRLKSDVDGRLVYDTGPTLKFMANAASGIQARNNADTGFIPLQASAFTVNSQREMKHGIEPFTVSEMGNTALEEVCTTPVYKYHYHDDTESEIKRTGIIIDTAPLDIVSLDGVGIDAYQMLSLAYKAIQELNEKVVNLENKVLALESNRDE